MKILSGRLTYSYGMAYIDDKNLQEFLGEFHMKKIKVTVEEIE